MDNLLRDSTSRTMNTETSVCDAMEPGVCREYEFPETGNIGCHHCQGRADVVKVPATAALQLGHGFRHDNGVRIELDAAPGALLGRERLEPLPELCFPARPASRIHCHVSPIRMRTRINGPDRIEGTQTADGPRPAPRGLARMNVDPSLLPSAVLWLSWPVFVIIALPVLVRAPWALLLDNGLQPQFVGACALVALAWSTSVEVQPGPAMHLLGTTVLTLLFGRMLAIAGATGALVTLSGLGLYEWQAFPVNGLLLAVLPVVVAHAIGHCAYRWLPRHLFIYVFVVAFFGAMLAMAAVLVASAALYAAVGAHPLGVNWHDYLMVMPLLMFPEGFVTGMIVTMCVVFRPEWVRTFDDRDYLIGK